MAIDTERRKHPRIKAGWPVSVLTEHGTIIGETIDIGVDGLSIQCDEPLQLDEFLKMAIIPPNQGMIEFTGKIIWSDLYGLDNDDTAFGMGICFVEISDKDHHFFMDLLSSHQGS